MNRSSVSPCNTRSATNTARGAATSPSSPTTTSSSPVQDGYLRSIGRSPPTTPRAPTPLSLRPSPETRRLGDIDPYPLPEQGVDLLGNVFDHGPDSLVVLGSDDPAQALGDDHNLVDSADVADVNDSLQPGPWTDPVHAEPTKHLLVNSISQALAEIRDAIRDIPPTSMLRRAGREAAIGARTLVKSLQRLAGNPTVSLSQLGKAEATACAAKNAVLILRHTLTEEGASLLRADMSTLKSEGRTTAQAAADMTLAASAQALAEGDPAPEIQRVKVARAAAVTMAALALAGREHHTGRDPNAWKSVRAALNGLQGGQTILEFLRQAQTRHGQAGSASQALPVMPAQAACEPTPQDYAAAVGALPKLADLAIPLLHGTTPASVLQMIGLRASPISGEGHNSLIRSLLLLTRGPDLRHNEATVQAVRRDLQQTQPMLLGTNDWLNLEMERLAGDEPMLKPSDLDPGQQVDMHAFKDGKPLYAQGAEFEALVEMVGRVAGLSVPLAVHVVKVQRIGHSDTLVLDSTQALRAEAAARNMGVQAYSIVIYCGNPEVPHYEPLFYRAP